MLWVLFFLLSAAVAIPALVAFGRAGSGRGRREAALALHRAQLTEVDRERAQGRIGEAEHAAALLEVKRRLLKDGGDAEQTTKKRVGWGTLAAILVIVPIIALALYLPAGDPGLPAAPFAPRLKAAEAEHAKVVKLVALLERHLATLDPRSEEARKGFLLLGRVEATQGDFAAAAAAWQKALADKFDPTVAAAAGEAETQAVGRVDQVAAALFERALAAAPADAPWRKLVKQRLAEARVP